MDQLHTILLVIHIISGSLGLLSGTLNLVLKKGDLTHRRVGKIFTYSMLTAGISAIVLAMLRPIPFLLIVGVFTVYMTGTGYRYTRIKGVIGKVKRQWVDWVLVTGMIGAAGLFLVWGSLKLIAGDLFGLIFLVFGLISVLFIRADMANYQGKSSHVNYWQTAHLQRMTGAYIASLTAFLVVNNHIFPGFIPGWAIWLLPTVILTPLIVRWSRKYAISKKS